MADIDKKISELPVRGTAELTGEELLPFAELEGNGAVTVESLREHALGKFKPMSQDEYDALPVKDEDTYYMIYEE